MVAPPVTIDAAPPGRRFIPIIGGAVTHPYKGHVLRGGGDWRTMMPDGRLEISAHHILDLDGHGAV